VNVCDELESVLRELVGTDARPIVVYSAAWPFFKLVGRADAAVVGDLLNAIVGAAGKRSLLMPTFAGGYRDGFCDLDRAPSTTGVISEAFRKGLDCKRTLSAFFSFSIKGEAASDVAQLTPDDAWGDGSVYHWFEKQNARFVLLGTDPTHCSFLHRVEWLLRDVIPYRYDKTFQGVLRRDGRDYPCRERLFVRCLSPEAENNFTVLKDALRLAGMVTTDVRGVPIALYDAQQVLRAVLPLMRKDPLVTLVNRSDFGG
jgi:aminoglycoside N3'-acetyltransferase